jgi:hypothetical protein
MRKVGGRYLSIAGATIGVATVLLIHWIGIAHLSDPLGVPALAIFAAVGALLGYLFGNSTF